MFILFEFFNNSETDKWLAPITQQNFKQYWVLKPIVIKPTMCVLRCVGESRTHPKIGQTLPWIKTKCRGMVVGNVSHTPELRFYWSLISIISRAWFTHFPSPALLCV